MGFFEKNPIFRKSDKGSKFAEECDWDSDISQHVTKKEISKTRLAIRKTSWVSLKTAKSSQFDAECNRYSKFSLKVQNLGFLLKKINGIFDKFLDICKITKNSIVALQGHWKNKVSQNVQKLVLLNKLNVFFEKKLWFP